ncbi:hypothetical protein, partial [Mycobacterium marinum]
EETMFEPQHPQPGSPPVGPTFTPDVPPLPHVGTQWRSQPTPPSNSHRHASQPPQPLFQVQVSRHTGLLVAYFTQSYTVTGTLDHCEAAIRDAQRHNLTMGWWSITSVLVMNWIALLDNRKARNTLRRQAGQRSHRLPGPGAVAQSLPMVRSQQRGNYSPVASPTRVVAR